MIIIEIILKQKYRKWMINEWMIEEWIINRKVIINRKDKKKTETVQVYNFVFNYNIMVWE